MDKLIYFSIKKHFEDNQMDIKFLFFPKEQVEAYIDDFITQGELTRLLSLVNKSFRITNEEGISLNPQELPLNIFLEENQNLYSFPRMILFLSNLTIIENKILEINELFANTITKQLMNEFPNFIKSQDKVEKNTIEQLSKYTIRDLKSGNIRFNLQV